MENPFKRSISIQLQFSYLIGYGDATNGCLYNKNVFFSKGYDMNFEQFIRFCRKSKEKGLKVIRNTLDNSSLYTLTW